MEDEEAVTSELKMQLENEALSTEEKISLLIDALNKVLNSAALQKPSRALAGAKARLYDSGVLSHCVQVLSLGPSRLRGSWTAAARLAHLTSSSCVGAEPGSRSETFHRLFLPSVMDALLSLAGQLMSLSQSSSLFRKVMDSVSWLLSAHPHLTPQVLSSAHYEQIQMSDDVSVCLLCIQMWIHSCTANRYQEVSSERVRAACAIQAAWRSYQTRRRVKNLSRAVSALQRRYRARRRLQQEQKEAQQWEEQLRYQVCVRRQQARRRFHQKQRELLQRLPPDQVQPYLQECERRAAVVIQSFWRGFRERRRYADCLRDALRESQRQRRAARTLQRAGRRFLEKRRAAKAPPIAPLWIGQEGLTDSRRAELKQQLDEYIAVHRSTGLSAEEGAALHAEVQLLLQAELQKGEQRRREEQRVEALLACARTQLELLQDAPPLSDVTAKQAESFLSPSASIAARARDAHNAALQASRLPWWRNLGETPTGEETGHAHLQELEAEFGGLFIGGAATVEGGPEVEL
ncbi:PREDICTED: IQ calmodulin-binding motif-containing protein 1 [Cyprinodon variegatus]|uniref:IQ calmodulin-binding motif-containing protein 1 n=1 Tax=Cyprinodon variegatus TaxID=28743 RepID=UPI0007425CC9|nr:PREDICTED: IQ calmodulin-binding motif-containing protein 1 [Cyprinodon variegatus]